MNKIIYYRVYKINYIFLEEKTMNNQVIKGIRKD